ncbi:MAG: protein-export chaperone SecB, partial [Pseudolabrys sp.]|nr:protein-export chaperone SecB [Pseudolabrys sp.]
MTTTNGGQSQDFNPEQAPQLNVVAQYIKDFSFENPNAPKSLVSGEQPQIGIQINVNAAPISDTDIEVVLQLSGKAETGGSLMFS